MYFNHKYHRVGFLCQDNYKANLVQTPEQFLYLTKYIHKQALASQGPALQGWGNQPSSYQEYLGLRKTQWVHPEEVLSSFSSTNPTLFYEAFIKEEENPDMIQSITLED